MKNILSPSILAADFWKLGEQIRQLEEAGAEWLHIDVMDGIFVPSISFGMPLLESLRGRTNLFFDVHLMIEKPERYVKEFARCGADMIVFHIEACENVEQTLKEIHALGKKAGIAIKPGTPAEAAEPYLEMADMVLVMTVEPGFGGQKLIPSCLDKVRAVRSLVEARGLCTDIQVDGGVYAENLKEALEAGSNVIVAGSALFKHGLAANIHAFREIMK